MDDRTVEPAARLLGLLADGSSRSGVALGETLGCSRAAVWKQARRLREMGLEVLADRQSGYRLHSPVELLNADVIRGHLPAATARSLGRLETCFSTGSTSDALIRARPPAPGRLHALLAEFQTGGRGRRGRAWLSPLGGGLCLSTGWSYDIVPAGLPSLTLAVGAGIADGLEAVGIEGVGLKWPNDLVSGGRKLGGILVDVAGESRGPLHVVVGVGVNVSACPPGPFPAGSLPPGRLADHGGARLSRNALAAVLIASLHDVLVRFGREGFSAYTESFRRRDTLRAQPITVEVNGRRTEGIGCGIADDGSLLLDTGTGPRPILAGDVSPRSAEPPG